MKEILYGLIFLYIASVIAIWFDFSGIAVAALQRRQQRLERERAVFDRPHGRLYRFWEKERSLMQESETSLASYLMLALACVGCGGLLSVLAYGTSAVAVSMTVICIGGPHVYLTVMANKKRITRAEDLQTAMTLITYEYLNCMDIEKAITANLKVLEYSRPFREFLVDMKMVSANTERNLRRLESKEENLYFSRWIDQLILTQRDRTQVVNLMPILDDMNDAKQAQWRSDTAVASAWREYGIVAGIILLSPLIIRIVQYEWYSYLIGTGVGQLMMILLQLALVHATWKAIQINKPLVG